MSYQTRMILLDTQERRAIASSAVMNAPTDLGLEVVIRKKQKVRWPDANARMWVGPLKDIAEQAWMNGRQYSAEIWHEYAKREFLPESDHPDLDKLVKDSTTWRKWDIDLHGNRICIGSTTQLTPYGFSQHLMQLEALGASMGVMFSESPNRMES